MANFIPKFEYTHPTNGATTISLTLPPTGDPLKERFVTNGRETRSNSGKTQYQLNYSDHTFELNLIFLDVTLKNEILEMFQEYASFGNSFKYYPSNDEVDFHNVIWQGSKKTFEPVKVIASGGDFIYDLKIPLRVEL